MEWDYKGYNEGFIQKPNFVLIQENNQNANGAVAAVVWTDVFEAKSPANPFFLFEKGFCALILLVA